MYCIESYYVIVQKGRFASCAGYITFNTREDTRFFQFQSIRFVYTYATAIFTKRFFILIACDPTAEESARTLVAKTSFESAMSDSRLRSDAKRLTD